MFIDFIIARNMFKHLQDMVERYVHWNEDIGEWQLKCVAYTGNNMRKQLDNGDAEKENQVRKIYNLLYSRFGFAFE